MSADPIRMSVLVEQNKALDEYNKVLEERNRLLVALLDSHARDVAAHREVFDPSDNAGEDGFESHLRALSLSSQLGSSKNAVLEVGHSIDLAVVSFAPFEVERILIPSEVSSMLRVDAVLVDGRPQRHGSTREGSFDAVPADTYREDAVSASRHYKACRSFVVRVTNVGGVAIPLSSQGIQRVAAFGRYVLCTAAERDLEEKLHRAEAERDLAIRELETLTRIALDKCGALSESQPAVKGPFDAALPEPDGWVVRGLAWLASEEQAEERARAAARYGGSAVRPFWLTPPTSTGQEAAATQEARPFPSLVRLLEWGKTRNAVRREAIKAIRAYGAWVGDPLIASGKGLASGNGLADMLAGLPFFTTEVRQHGPFCISLPPGSVLGDAFSARSQLVTMIRRYVESASIDVWVERVLCHRFATDAALVSGVVTELVGIVEERRDEAHPAGEGNAVVRLGHEVHVVALYPRNEEG